MQKLTPINNLFHDRGHFSTSKYAMLLSTTFKLGHYQYCIHCGEGASAVQGGLCRRYRNTELEHHKTTSHRCNCDGAIEEMIEKLALSLLKQRGKESMFDDATEYAIERDHYLAIIQSKNSPTLPLSGESQYTGMTPKIYNPSFCDFQDFVTFEDMDITMYTRDDYYKFTPIYQFIERLELKIKELKGELVDRLKSQITEVESMKVNIHKR
ncbi:hypothetical protein VCHA53O466_140103 [Vibrio chagasii]|nr:hypothetical protein VCHA53O466_140103 [Vibrio chagasii]